MLRGQKQDMQVARVLEPFVASAVDPASKTVLAAGGDGSLKFYSYPDFQPRGSVQIGGTAFRLAFDARRGLLYAFVSKDSNPSATVGSPDQAVGDMHVYDVKALLNSGTSGSASALKPLTVRPLGASIYRAALSVDGRRLYWLQGRTTQPSEAPKACKLVAYNTETRAVDRTFAPPDGTDTFCLTPDGKAAYVAGSSGDRRDGSNPPHNGWIIEVDPAAMLPRQTVEIEPDPFDIDATDSGLVYLAGKGNPGRSLVAVVDMKTSRSVVASWMGGAETDYIKVSPDRSRLYLMDMGVSPPDLKSWKLDPIPSYDPVESGRITNGAGTPLQGAFQVTPDGQFLLSGRGAVIRLQLNN